MHSQRMLQHSKNFARARKHTRTPAPTKTYHCSGVHPICNFTQGARINSHRREPHWCTCKTCHCIHLRTTTYTHICCIRVCESEWSSHHQFACDSDIKRIIIFSQVRFARLALASAVGAAAPAAPALALRCDAATRLPCPKTCILR